MRTSDFDFVLPPELIAQAPASERDGSRLLVMRRAAGSLEHRRFRDLPDYLQAGDVLVLNDSRVIRARLDANSAATGGSFEVLLLEENAANDWWVMMRPAKRARMGTKIAFRNARGEKSAAGAVVIESNAEGHRRLRFEGAANILDLLGDLGEVPLPPYIERPDATNHRDDAERYQTVFARSAGSVAAPTAGLHFTSGLLEDIRKQGVRVCFLTLHVGPGTFAPVKSPTIAGHVMHEERYTLGEETARVVNKTKTANGRVFAVGTTTMRVLESVAARHNGCLAAESGRTRIFIYPPYEFRIADALLTNFHLPRSTLLMLASAFAAPGETRGRELVISAYAEAIRQRYRFYSYGDAMLML